MYWGGVLLRNTLKKNIFKLYDLRQEKKEKTWPIFGNEG